MAAYRKKPVVIEAMHFGAYTKALPGDDDWHDLWRWLNAGKIDWRLASDPDGRAHILITTLEGVMRADVGDWIIRGVKGEFYPCKPDIFEATYEPAAPSEAEQTEPCPACKGRRTIGGATSSAIVAPWPCPECGGSGTEAAIEDDDGPRWPLLDLDVQAGGVMGRRRPSASEQAAAEAAGPEPVLGPPSETLASAPAVTEPTSSPVIDGPFGV